MKKIELLAPAGGRAQFIAAVENGADAVYIGGKNFSARAGAQNFSDEEAEEAIDYGHLRNVRTYVAMNTLMDDSDLKPAYEQARRYYEMGADALIIQDLGLGRILKKYLPDMPLHLSTQAGVCDGQGVSAATRLGYERVVLARETDAQEIKKAAEKNVEIEVFVHGALCICYSGQCQLSRWIGGRSGNKGTCAQPCRLPYRGSDGKYPLSPRDLCLIGDIKQLWELGVTSFKIEGRMKSPEYVAVVTSIYRKYIDRCIRGEGCSVSPEDMERLKQIFNRGGFTKGYLHGDPGSELMAADFSKNSGVYVGKVARDSRGPLTEITDMPDFDKRRPIEKGDYVEIRSEKLTGNLVTYIRQKNDNIVIGDIKGSVSKGDEVYRLISETQMKEAKATFDNIDFKEGKYFRKTPVTMDLKLIVGKEMSLFASSLGETVKVTSDVLPEPSKSGVSFAETAENQLMKTGGTVFCVERIRIHEPEPSFASISCINSLRREALSLLEKEIIRKYKKAAPAAVISSEPPREEEDILEIYFAEGKLDSSIIDKALSVKKNVRCAVPAADYAEFKKTLNENYRGIDVRPYLTPMEKIDELKIAQIEEQLQDRTCPVYVNNIGQIEAFKRMGHRIYGDHGLNVTNAEAQEAYRQLGVIWSWPSLEKAHSWQGNYPLMVTEHEFRSGGLTDRKGQQYDVMFYEGSHKAVIRSKKSPVMWEKAGRMRAIRVYF